ncbi:hypothetical protein [Streptacidiphilus monticola]|uniref:Transcriptional regulator n=1 Tax=Streptacidiphilus monticola TaxID=2161674 RepID=A0ABW1FUH6_9ACTN
MSVETRSRPGEPGEQPTLLRVLLQRQGWDTWSRFELHFDQAARRAARELGNPRLGTVTASRVTFKRWLAGEQAPRGDTATVLEHLLGVDVQALLAPAPTREIVPARPPHPASPAVARALDAGWSSSSLNPVASGPGLGGVWQLHGRTLFDGTFVPVQLYEAASQDDVVLIGPEDHPHLRAFVQPTRRALLLASLAGAGNDELFVLDAAHGRRHLAVDPVETLPVPLAYRLDDLSYALLWAVLNVDDALGADDHELAAEEARLVHHLDHPRSAVARAAVPELSNVGAAWLGSRFCGLHTARRLGAQPLDEVQAWSRIRSGEEAAAWLLFRGEQERIDRAERPSGTAVALCLPEAQVKESERYERLLVLLAAARMESAGVTVRVCTEQEYAQMDEFLLLPGRRAVVANWLRAEGVWHADTVDSRPQLRVYAQAVQHARAAGVVRGADPARRLRALAGYLDLDWAWLTGRCREFAGYGLAGMLRPRSRLVDLAGVDRALRHLGAMSGL